jgi:preprotein translocase subunit SecE
LAAGRGIAILRALQKSIMAKTSPIEFFKQVRQEVARVTWPSRKETTVTTAMVFLMVFAAAIFFFVIDQLLSQGVRLVLGTGA